MHMYIYIYTYAPLTRLCLHAPYTPLTYTPLTLRQHTSGIRMYVCKINMHIYAHVPCATCHITNV